MTPSRNKRAPETGGYRNRLHSSASLRASPHELAAVRTERGRIENRPSELALGDSIDLGVVAHVELYERLRHSDRIESRVARLGKEPSSPVLLSDE